MDDPQERVIRNLLRCKYDAALRTNDLASK
jgi:hypothetical protein